MKKTILKMTIVLASLALAPQLQAYEAQVTLHVVGENGIPVVIPHGLI
jgi:hypothetical protein